MDPEFPGLINGSPSPISPECSAKFMVSGGMRRMGSSWGKCRPGGPYDILEIMVMKNHEKLEMNLHHLQLGMSWDMTKHLDNMLYIDWCRGFNMIYTLVF
jgi:hypothetical protein